MNFYHLCQQHRRLMILVTEFQWSPVLLIPAINFSLLTMEKIFRGVVDTGDNIFLQCCWYWSEITKKSEIIKGVNKPVEKLLTGFTEKWKICKNSIFRCKVRPTKLLTKYGKNYTSKFFSFNASVFDTVDKHSFVNISANFWKKLKWS